MSGITGIFSRDGSAVNRGTVEAMADKLCIQGFDNSDIRIKGSIGIGREQLVTTPEARYESAIERNDGYLLTADARIDNRNELQTQLNVSPDPVVTDADLILAAYDQWGQECPEYLVGAFAFAIWDTEKKRLFCARDHVGLRPLFYVNTNDMFALASEIGSLADREFVSNQLDGISVGDFLLGFYNVPEPTFYDDICALPPAHWAVVNADSVKIQQYWSLDGPEIELNSDEAYLEEFRNRFREAVRARLRTPENVRVASTLSGGLDSSSIACVGNSMTDRPLPTISVTFDDIRGSDESEYIGAVHDHLDFDSHFVRGDQHSPFEHVDEMLDRLDEPFISNTLYLHWEMFRAASDENVRVLLDGYGGDQVISRGLARFPQLAITGKPLELVREMWKHADRYDSTIQWQLYRRVLTPLEPEPTRKLRRKLFGSDNPVAQRSDVIDSEFVDRVGLRSRARELGSRRQRTTRADQRRILGGGSQATGLEIANISAATFGVEPRFPFFDRRVMEFCFRTPGHLKLRDGWRRWLLRNALSDILPPKIRDRTTKGNLAVAYYETLRSRDSDELRDLFTADQFPPYLDQERVQSEFEKFMEGDESNVLANVWRPALLCRWFELTDRYD